MARLSLALRFFLLYGFAPAAFVAAVGLVGARQVERALEGGARRALERVAALLMPEAEERVAADPRTRARWVQRRAQEVDLAVILLESHGVPVSASPALPGARLHGALRNTLRRAAAFGQAWGVTEDPPTLWLVRRLGGAETGRGYLCLGAEQGAAAAAVAGVRRLVWALTVGLLAMGALLAGREGFLLGRDLEVLCEALRAGGRGERPPRTSHAATRAVGEAMTRAQREAELRLRVLTEERDHAFAVLESMVEGVVAVDEEQRILQVNPPATGLLGLPTDGAAGRRLWEVTRVHEACALVERALQEGREALQEVRVGAGREERVLRLQVAPLRRGQGGRQGTHGGAVLMILDVTEQRRLERVRTDFVANVSHELKTPVTAIRGLVETVLENPDLDGETRRRFLEKACFQAERLSRLVQDLLTLSRLEAGGEVLERHWLDLREPVAQAVEAERPAAEARGIHLEASLREEVPVFGDFEALRQAAENLVQNAVRYTEQNGHVWVRVRRDERGAVLEVEDDGPGIEPEHQERIFERFYRADRARSRELGGTGLGLAIVKHVVQAHEGAVTLESEPGRGSLFRVRLPSIAG